MYSLSLLLCQVGRIERESRSSSFLCTFPSSPGRPISAPLLDLWAPGLGFEKDHVGEDSADGGPAVLSSAAAQLSASSLTLKSSHPQFPRESLALSNSVCAAVWLLMLDDPSLMQRSPPFLKFFLNF